MILKGKRTYCFREFKTNKQEKQTNNQTKQILTKGKKKKKSVGPAQTGAAQHNFIDFFLCLRYQVLYINNVSMLFVSFSVKKFRKPKSQQYITRTLHMHFFYVPTVHICDWITGIMVCAARGLVKSLHSYGMTTVRVLL